MRVATTHILCCSWGMYFSAAASSENDQGNMNLAWDPGTALFEAGRRGSPPSTELRDGVFFFWTSVTT